MTVYFNINAVLFCKLLFQIKLHITHSVNVSIWELFTKPVQMLSKCERKKKKDKLKFVELWAIRLIVLHFHFKRDNSFVALFCFQNVIYLVPKRANRESKSDNECRKLGFLPKYN